MIIERVHRGHKVIAGVMAWLLAAQVTLPVFAYSGNNGGRAAYVPLPSKHKPGVPAAAWPGNRPSGPDMRLPRTPGEPLLNSQGPSQPEMASFQSVGTANMVDPFTGDFSYNVPLLDVGGYPVNIHYTSNVGMDQEPSWVGLGWNINPGSVSRNMRGLPDDFNGVDSIKKTVSTKPNINLGVSAGFGAELIGFPLSIGANLGITYNNYKGYGLETGFNLRSPIGKASETNGGTMAGSLSFSNSSTDGLGIAAGLSYSAKMAITEGKDITGSGTSVFGGTLNYNSRAGLTSLSVEGGNEASWKSGEKGHNSSFSIPGSMTFSRPTFTPGTEIPYTSLNTSFNVKGGLSLFGVFGNGNVGAQMGVQYVAPGDTTNYYPAYGYLNYSKAGGNSRALLDYNRENDGPFVDKVTPAIAIPQYTYDTYTISAEGTGGSFRPYRSDAGYVYPTYNQTKSAAVNAGIDFGLNKFGANIKPVISFTTTKAWLSDNKLRHSIGFQQKDSVFEDAVFRNPTEMPIQSGGYLDAIGHDTLVRPSLEGPGVSATLGNSLTRMPDGTRSTGGSLLKKAVVKDKREKRNQVISYLSAADATLYGLDKNILSYKDSYVPYTYCAGGIDTIPRVDNGTRKGHHLSEVTVLNEDGRRYIYGVPAYTLMEQSMTFAVKPSGVDEATGQAGYTAQEASADNRSGVDGYFSSQTVPGYAHSFLLSGILSTDYVDVTGNGITDDDLGDAVKFDYTRYYGGTLPFGWRVPLEQGKASYQPGLKTYSRDDKASIVRGEKEVWYLHSVVSKNMVAVFRTSDARPDAVSQAGLGGQPESTKKLRRLDRIDLYTKAALVAGGTPRPVKSVHFKYDYSLCVKGGVTGKLTLTEIWFTYNGGGKKSNPYKFTYSGAGGNTGVNPAYQPRHTDVWGNYKDPANNPGGLSNQDYPYVVQGDKAKADLNASAWSLTDITLPSKGAVKVTYESDDYGYVQDRRAMQLYKVAGMAATSGGSPVPQLWSAPDPSIGGKTIPYEYVFVDVPDPVYSNADVYSKYLEGVRQLYLKLFISVPGDRFGSGSEFVPMVCEIDGNNYGFSSANRIWLKVKRVGDVPPMGHYALQFLKENLPSKAYPGSETGTDPDLKGIINMIGSQVTNVTTMVTGFDNDAKARGICRDFTAARSFIKLNNPTMTKYGGGLRVRKVEVFDNFKAMTGNAMADAVYGQEYDYTTTGSIVDHGVTKVIPISSGVATYEPFIGGEENPIKGYYAYQQQMAKLGPVSLKFVDTPFCESMFPGASVGYSKVTVRSVNKKYLSATGKEVHTFYTYKDFPTRWSFTPLDDNSRKRHQPGIANFLKLNAQHYLTLSQGFKVELNDMHGKMRSHAFYSEADTVNPITYTENIYRTKTVPGQRRTLDNRVWAAAGPEAVIDKEAAMGQGVEIMTDLREQGGFNASANIELNVDMLNLGFFYVPLPGFMLWPQFERTRFRSASVMKVVNNYGILDSVYQVDKGSVVATKNLVYDSETGNVLLTRTNNEYRDPVYNYSYPAKWAYSGMGMAYKNIHAEFGKTVKLDMKNGRLYYMGTYNPFPMERYFESGDECAVGGAFVQLDNQADPECQPIYNNASYNAGLSKAWVINAKKDTAVPPQLFFIDRDGRPLNINSVTIKILRSGFRNLTTSSVGSVTMLANPIEDAVAVPGQIIKVSDAKNVVNATAASFRDCWKVDNNLYAKDTTVRVYSPTTYGEIDAHTTLLKIRKDGGVDGIPDPIYVTRDNATAGNPLEAICSHDYIDPSSCRHSIEYRTKAILNFDIDAIPDSAIIDHATLEMLPRIPPKIWNREDRNNGFLCTGSVYNYDWANGQKWFSGGTVWNDASHRSSLKRFTGNYNYNTGYDNFGSLLTEANKFVITSSPSLASFDLTLLANDMINNRAGGGKLMLELDGAASATLNNPIFMSFADTIQTSKGVLNAIKLIIDYRAKTDSTYILCKKSITDTTNPYRWGIYGNWRPERSYIFYHDRRQLDSTGRPTDLRRDGTLKDFIPYWEVTAAAGNLIKPTVDTTKWVWNTASTLVNSKGAEVESVDALRRYSSGHYGYNGNLPVAVVQNAMYREAVFDGFEDYRYKDKYCDTLCPNPRFADFTKFTSGSGILVDTVSHTGLYSLRVPNNFESKLAFPLYDSLNDPGNKLFPCPTCGVKTKVDSTEILDTMILAKGKGLTRNIYYSGTTTRICPDMAGRDSVNFNTFDIAQSLGCAAIQDNYFDATWAGFVQAPEKGTYTFRLRTSSSATSKYLSVDYLQGSGAGNTQTVQAVLEKGQMVPVDIIVSGTPATDQIYLTWSSNNRPEETVVPRGNLYINTGSDSLGSLKPYIRKWCVKMNRPKANVDTFLVLPPFSPIKNTGSFIVSAWVKETGVCQGTYNGEATIGVAFDNSPSVYTNLVATGVPIDGWQRLEATVSGIPQAAGKMLLRFFSDGNPFYVDDIRFHPFNASMKSFVYNPLNLRLMAELDENNYASFYEYDEDGTLIRVKKETERGIQTIKETRSALGK